ncbi:primosomal protein N' [Guyparkeria hydrothermalis]|uniref:primosomal protein N' n=1 Tax=Guyparkeria hydrothermalis TaxID=923 RepID=UPI00201FCF64|nr:primosomal protein N' [Guyparkeria hydrothermalis]MCL7750838.1 primosomal protein N' [Guyparkeria hydrothermalis]
MDHHHTANPSHAATPTCWTVVVPGPFFGGFTYHFDLDAGPAPGVRVRVPFGQSERVAVVIEPASAEGEQETRPILEVLDEAPLLDDRTLACLRWAAAYYHHPLGEVVFAALPKALRGERRLEVEALVSTPAGRSALEAGEAKGERQREALSRLVTSAGPVPVAKLGPAAVRRRLVEKGWAEPTRMTAPAEWSVPVEPGSEAAPALNAEQQGAVDAIVSAGEGFRAWLLHGVTGSGKTEVYLALIERELAAGRQVLVVVPEISLTPQLIDRFARRLSVRPAVLHSGLADGERLAAWRAVAAGTAGLVIGTRSAAFVPLARPGLIVVDEEHDAALKQQEGFLYHARDVLVWRARQLAIPILLGSATPSLESLRHAWDGRYGHLRLTERASGATMPAIHCLDVRGQTMVAGLSPALLRAIERHLLAGGQVMLYLNRRGYAPSLVCHACGFVAGCPHCDAFLTWHRQIGRLRCHHCGFEQGVPADCPSCQAPLSVRGMGTEQLEDVLAARFPGFGIVRLDRDATAGKGVMADSLARIARGEARLVVGTQMLVKGHDFPGVTLVGVVNADQALFASDFRGPERFAQSLLQVAGRAGRAERPGEVLVQTHDPEHPVLRRLLSEDYEAVMAAQLVEREQAELPPTRFAGLIRADAPQADAARGFLAGVADQLRERFGDELAVWGPVPAPLARRAGRYRFQLLLLAQVRSTLHRALWAVDDSVGSRRLGGRLRWSIDVDPIDLA